MDKNETGKEAKENWWGAGGVATLRPHQGDT